MRDFRNYKVWNDSIEFSLLIYKVSGNFPDEEKFGLVSQMRRAAVSVSSNIAEGCGRSSEREFSRFLEISLGSVFELRTQSLIAGQLNFIGHDQFQLIDSLVDQVSKQLNGLINKLK